MSWATVLLWVRTGLTFISAALFLDTFLIARKEVARPWAFFCLMIMSILQLFHRMIMAFAPDVFTPLLSSISVTFSTILLLAAAIWLNRVWKAF